MKKGFTLIELIVVMAIIAILAGVIASSVGSSDKTNQATGPALAVAQTTEVTLPEATNYAVDTAGVLTPEQLASLNTQLKALDDGKRQLAVLITNSTQPLSIEEYGIKLGDKWKVGYKGTDEGAIIIIAVKDRKARIEVGHGLEGDLTDSQAGTILREQMVPLLSKGDWYNAVMAGINGIEAKIK